MIAGLSLVPPVPDPWPWTRKRRLHREIRTCLACTAAVWERDDIDAADDVLRQHWAALTSRFGDWLPTAEAEGWL